MDQMVVEYVINESVTWSDGTRVTGADSVFSFEIAQHPERPGLKWAETRTEEYLAVDQRLVRWTGKPGFSTSKIDAFFWSPLPSYLFSGLEAWSELSAAENLSRLLLSYGPFILVDWVEGGMQLTPNPYYYRAVDGLPALDRVIIKALAGGGAEAVGAIQSGVCDVLDTSFKLENNAEVLSAVQQDEELNLHLGQSQSWTQLVFGIQPASYDVFYNPIYGDRPDFFGDPRTRQAIAACLDMNAILAAGTQGLGQMRSSFTAPGFSQLSSLESINFDPTFGMNLLGELGWVNHDDNPETPLQAWSVSNVPNGTTFVVELLTSQSPYHLSLGEAIVQSLGACGIGVDVQSMPSPDLYAPGPDGRLFGRSFDLALIAWQPEPELDCKFYLSNKIPNNENAWVGTNIAGFNHQMYDSVCATAALALPGEYASALYEAEMTYLDALPAVPLISSPQAMVTAGNICLKEGVFTGEAAFYQWLEKIEVDCP
jgi:peptide/nickel transport system substrate-binding protein